MNHEYAKGLSFKAKRNKLDEHLLIQLYELFHNISKYRACSKHLMQASFMENFTRFFKQTFFIKKKTLICFLR